MGNIHSVTKALESLEEEIILIKNTQQIKDCKALILPGVGSFDAAIQMLFASELIQKIEDLVLNESMPILGVCVGMQIMARKSEEGEKNGLKFY